MLYQPPTARRRRTALWSLTPTARGATLLAIAAAVFVLAGLALTAPSRAVAVQTLRIPEKVGSWATSGNERWGYDYSSVAGLGGTVSNGARSDTRKVTRTLVYRVSGDRAGLKLDVRALHTIRYEVYVSGPHRGAVYRVYKPTVVLRSASATYLLLWRLSVKMANAVISVIGTPAGGSTYIARHAITLTLPRQATVPGGAVGEVMRRYFSLVSGEYERSVTLVPDGRWGYLVVRVG